MVRDGARRNKDKRSGETTAKIVNPQRAAGVEVEVAQRRSRGGVVVEYRSRRYSGYSYESIANTIRIAGVVPSTVLNIQ